MSIKPIRKIFHSLAEISTITLSECAKHPSEFFLHFDLDFAMHVGHNNQKFCYVMGGQQIGESKEEKDLGVWMESSLKPGKQCTVAAKVANFTL